MDEHRLGRIAHRQDGLFTRADALTCGFSSYQVTRRMAAGQWRTVIGSTLAPAGMQITPELFDRAAQLALAGSVMAGPSAARVWGMPVRDDRTVLLIPPSCRRRLPGVLIMRLEVPHRDIGTVRGRPATWQARTVFDCLRLLPAADGDELLDRALQQRWATPEELLAFARRMSGGMGCRGSGGCWGRRGVASGRWPSVG